MVAAAFEKIASQELAYRALGGLTPEDVLMDAFGTALLVGMRGPSTSLEYAELAEGTKKLASFIYSGFFSLDSAILCASKAAYLRALLVKRGSAITRFDQRMDLTNWSIANPDYNRLNKLKKTSSEAFFYFHQAVALME